MARYWDTIKFYNNTYFKLEEGGDHYYKLEDMRQLDSSNPCLLISFVQVAYRESLFDTVEAVKESDRDSIDVIVYILEETITDAIENEYLTIVRECDYPKVMLANGSMVALNEVN